AAFTDDRGEYRVAGVAPGKHYIAVEYNSAHQERTSTTRSRFRWPETGGLMLYPDATTIEQAEQVEVKPGQTLPLSDMRLKVGCAVTISGRIKPAAAGSKQMVSLMRTNRLSLSTSAMVQGAQVGEGGAFRLQALPGTYTLTAADTKTAKTSKPLTLNVGDKNIENLELDLSSEYVVKGRIVIDGSERMDFSKVVLNFGGGLVKLDENGTFEEHVGGNKGIYVLQDLPDGWFIKEVRLAGRPLAGRLFDLEPGTTELVMALSPKGGRVEITVP